MNAAELRKLKHEWYTPRKITDLEQKKRILQNRIAVYEAEIARISARIPDNWRLLMLDINFNLYKALVISGITRIEELTSKSWEEIASIKGLGEMRAQHIVQALDRAGIEHTICRPELRKSS